MTSEPDILKSVIDPKSLFDDIARFVADSRSLLGRGAIMELGGLDERVRVLCEHVLTLSGDDRLKYADLLQEMLSELQALSLDMRTQQDALAHEIRYLSSHKKANVAYKTADAADNFSIKKDQQ